MDSDKKKNDEKQSSVSGHELRKMRSFVFHVLYVMDSFDYSCSVESIIDNFNRGFDLSIPLDGDVFKIASAVIYNKEKIDDAIKPLLENWRFERIGCCTRLILRYAAWELLNSVTPANIVINEAIELAKCFSEKDAYKFVNGILDEVRKKLDELKESA
ncbi:transcription antitermination factor NusB [bacterium]|jgi:transcription antitermination protein NusB|nr:transcription antitermination factor NusB [bacterium]